QPLLDRLIQELRPELVDLGVIAGGAGERRRAVRYGGRAQVEVHPEGQEELIAVWVTYNDPCIEEFISEAKKFSPDGEFRAYQRGKEGVEKELAAVFYALREMNISYVSSTFSTTEAEEASYNQDVRLPWQSLKYRQMNCVEGAVLYSAILERLEYETAIAFVPGHAFVLVRSKKGWEEEGNFLSGLFGGWGGEWIAIETTDTGDRSISFEDAVRRGEAWLGGNGKAIRVHEAIERGIVPLPTGSHECSIPDLSMEAAEYRQSATKP
ncbi:MAG: hypothetical protein ABIN58_06850, partial [candidate division WOR-3 bacterium]